MIDERIVTEILRQRLSPKRYAHSLGVAQSAADLAERWGEDRARAHFAGLVHDVCKCDTVENMTRLLEESGHSFIDCERGNAKLLHAPAGAVYLAKEGLCDDPQILNAVRYHTTGRAGMSLLEKIVFTADLISAERKYPDVDTVRRLAFADLDGAMRYVLHFIINDLERGGKPIHLNSRECLAEKR